VHGAVEPGRSGRGFDYGGLAYGLQELAAVHSMPFSGTRLNDDLPAVACAGYFTVPINFVQSHPIQLIAGVWRAFGGSLPAPPARGFCKRFKLVG
jgi:hypothetical protein